MRICLYVHTYMCNVYIYIYTHMYTHVYAYMYMYELVYCQPYTRIMSCQVYKHYTCNMCTA